LHQYPKNTFNTPNNSILKNALVKSENREESEVAAQGAIIRTTGNDWMKMAALATMKHTTSE
jgi:hypothetical protein